MRPYIVVHHSGMLKNDIVNGLRGKAYPGDFGAFCNMAKQSPRHDGADQAPLIHRCLGPRRNRYRSNPAVLANQVNDDPAVLDHTELLVRDRRNLGAPRPQPIRTARTARSRIPLMESESGM